jgi:hypothetical protein
VIDLQSLKNSRKDLYDSILILLLLLNSGTLFNIPRLTEKFMLMTLFLWIVVLLIKYKAPLIKMYFINFTLIYLGLLILFCLQILFLPNNLLSFQYLTYSFQFLTLILILYYIKVTEINFALLLYRVLIVLMWYSIISFFLWVLLNGFLVRINIANHAYDTLFHLFYYQSTLGSSRSAERVVIKIFNTQLFIRNQGVFWEPGILQLYMNLLLFLAMNYYRSLKYSLLSVFVILTTISTTGITLLFLQLLAYVLKNTKKRKIFYVLPIVVSAVFTIGYMAQQNLHEKLEGRKQASALQRKLDTLASFNIVKDNPYAGIGLDFKNYYRLVKKSSLALRDLETQEPRVSNSVLFLFVFFGIPLGIFFLYGYYKQTLLTKERMIFFMIIVASCMAEPILLYPFFTLFMVSGLENILFKPKEK